ncbi:MAG: MFS transporter [Anaerolineaceae bacterium]|nr:MFS transporter [Anaerolineaceae bacterium]
MNRNLKLVTISLFIWGVGEGMFLLFQPIYLLKLGADPIAIGAILGGMGFMTTISQIPSGYLSDRFGPRPLMWFSWIWGTISAFLMALAGSLELFIVALLLFGFTGSVLAPMNAYITSERGNWSAERSLTFTSAAYHLGAVLGPTIGGFIGQQYDLRILYFISAFIFVISTIFVLFIKKPQIEIHHDIETSNNIFKNAAFMRIALLGFIALFFMVFTQNFATVFLTDLRQINLQQIGYLGTIGSIGNVVLALTLGHLPSKIGYLISFPFSILFPLLILNGKGFFGYGVGFFAFGGYRLARSMLLAMSREFIHGKDTGLAYGVIETTNGLAIIIAPFLCGIVYNQNPQSIFWISIIGLGIVAMINLILLPKQKNWEI